MPLLNVMATLTRREKVGEGTYGTVYTAEQKEGDVETVVAVKRNYKDLTSRWCGNVRELDMLTLLKGHPFIVELMGVCFKNPFTGDGRPMTPVDEEKRGMMDDTVHFVMEYVPTPLPRLIRSTTLYYTMYMAKLLSLQLLIGLEWMHARGVAHRDLKTPNLLVSLDAAEGPRLRICDFGMSHVVPSGTPPTPSVTTSWYRSPEICCGAPYGFPADMWAAGCVIFEMFSGFAFLRDCTDNNNMLFSAILGRLPVAPDRDVVSRLFAAGRPCQIYPEASPIRRPSIIERMELSPARITEFLEDQGTFEELADLLSKLLALDPHERLTASQALEHPFFAWLHPYTTGMRGLYPPMAPALPVIKIISCVERKWVINLANHLYNSRGRMSWYKHRIMFHAIDLFDRYLEWSWSHSTLTEHESTTVGRLHTRGDTELRFYVCLYLFHKYYATMTLPIVWERFTAPEFTNASSLIVAEAFETSLLDICGYRLHRDTLLEICYQYQPNASETTLRNLMLQYGQVDAFSGGSVRALYRTLSH